MPLAAPLANGASRPLGRRRAADVVDRVGRRVRTVIATPRPAGVGAVAGRMVRPLAEIPQRTAEPARAVIGPPVEVSVTLVDGDDASTPAATADGAYTLDEAQ